MKWEEHVATQQAILDEPRGPAVCVCGASGGSAHDHMAGVMVSVYVCEACKRGSHTCSGIVGRGGRNECVCGTHGHRR